MKQDEYNDGGLSRRVIGAAIEVHRHLGPGLLESAYERALSFELCGLGIECQTQVSVPCRYKGHDLGVGYRIDMLVESKLVVEIKSVQKLDPVAIAQTLSYLKLGDYEHALLFNFNVEKLTEGLHRLYKPR